MPIVILGGTQLTLESGGDRTCVVAFQRGFVMIGGYSWTTHGKVDRCKLSLSTVGKSTYLLLSVPGTTLKATT